MDPEKYVESSDRYFRPNEVDYLLGDSSKAREKLGWTPKISTRDMCQEMIEHDLKKAKKKKSINDLDGKNH